MSILSATGITIAGQVEDVLLRQGIGHGRNIHGIIPQVIIVETQTATLKSASAMAMPDKTAPVVDAGVKQPVPVSESVISRLSAGAKAILGGL